MFVTFEGIEGVGKTTQLKFFAQELEKMGISFIITREPGGTPMGEEIRDILLAHRHERVAPMTELLLMFAARAQHIDTVILPALKREQWVLCDRFVDASFAYQGGGRGVPRTDIESLEKLVLGELEPDLTLLFDAPVAIGLTRIHDRGNHADRFEQENLEFFERVRRAYLMEAQKNPKRYKVIDAGKSVEEVRKEVFAILNEMITVRGLRNEV